MAKPKSRLSTRDHILTLLQTRTQKQAAKILGIGERTIRRIKNEPQHRTTPRVEKIVAKVGQRERVKLRHVTPTQLRQRARQTIEHEHYESELPKKPRGRAVYVVPDIPVIPPSQRLTRLDSRDKNLKTRMWSDVVSFDVRKLSLIDVARLLAYYRTKKGAVSFNIIYRVPKGKNSMGGSNYPKGGQSGTGWEQVNTISRRTGKRVWDDKRIMHTLNEIITGRTGKGKQHNIMHVQIQQSK